MCCRDGHASTLAAAAQQFGERVAKVARAQSVDERIGGRVAVAEPEEHVEEGAGRAARRADGAEQVDGEERRPADDEAADDHADRLRRLRLAVQRP